MYKFLSKKLNERNENKNKIYKITGKLYETDNETFFSSEKGKIFENKSDYDIGFIIYKKRYLFVNYYQKNEPNKLISSVPRQIQKIDIIDLKDTSNKWAYDLRSLPRISIKSFDPKSGDIVYCNHIRPGKIITD